MSTAQFKRELATLLNEHSMDNETHTPDFILAEYLYECMDALRRATERRAEWQLEESDGKS